MTAHEQLRIAAQDFRWADAQVKSDCEYDANVQRFVAYQRWIEACERFRREG